jgi:predicted transglutaminase-like cysteine proteinase
MQRVHFSAIVVFGSMLAASGVCAQDVSAIHGADPHDRAALRSSLLHRASWPAQPPHGFVRFCVHPAGMQPDHAQRAGSTPAERLKELDDVNRSVNQVIVWRPTSKSTA